ncbi:unnamed protein product [Brugia pahangi]|uniref:Secreted protein n=1 Tax=Brugia pahangi TaxID=6280 RepID=A0A0N4TZ19_BRUPA|nr:unnamed protein product [Brugia pahangi]
MIYDKAVSSNCIATLLRCILLNGFPFPEEKYKQKHHKGAIIRLKLDYNCLLIHKDNMRAYSFCLQMINK